MPAIRRNIHGIDGLQAWRRGKTQVEEVHKQTGDNQHALCAQTMPHIEPTPEWFALKLVLLQERDDCQW